MLHTTWIDGTGDLTHALWVRRRVFVEEQGFSAEQDVDEWDVVARHVVLYEGARPIGTARMLPLPENGARLGRVAVLASHRAQGCGDLLMKLMMRVCLDAGRAYFVVHAQKDKAAFYARYGFAFHGEEYLEEGCPHIPMRVEAAAVVWPKKCSQARSAGRQYRAPTKM